MKLIFWSLLVPTVASVLTSSPTYTDTPPSRVETSGCSCNGDVDSLMECQGKCDQFPNNPIKQTGLRVTKTTISIIRNGDLSNLHNLTSLVIENNLNLVTIEVGVFKGMDILEYLSISFNTGLEYLANGTFEGLYKLTELKLEHNKFYTIGSVVNTLLHRVLPNLLRLSLSQNTLLRIEEYDLSPLKGTGLEELQFKLCQLDYIHPKAFSYFQNLRYLQLSQNLLNESTLTQLVRQMTDDNITLEGIDLGYMEFQNPPMELLTAIGQSGATTLILERNKFPTLRKGSFPRMPSLRYLSLKYCSIMTVEPGTFDSYYFPQLEQLTLAQNQLNGISGGILPSQVGELDISWNSYSNQHPVDFILGEAPFVNMTNLTTLNISFVYLETITGETFSGLGSLSVFLGLSNDSISYIQPGSFRELRNLTFLSLENNPFPARSGLTADIFEGLDSLESLVLKGCGISNFSDVNVFSPLKNLQCLMLDNNQIVKLNPQVLFPLHRLDGLSLDNNYLESWSDGRLFENNPNIAKVFLSNNKFTYLSYDMLEDFSQLSNLSLCNNMFICNCLALEHVHRWKTAGHNLSLNQILTGPDRGPFCEAPENWRGRELTVFLGSVYEDLCPSSLFSGYIWITVLLSLLFLLGVVGGVLGYIYRSHIRYWAFLVRMDLRRRGMSHYNGKKKVRCEGHLNCQYDAFVSYSSEDRNFVVRLVAMLENYEPFLKLCVYERDFEIGSMISESVLESVATSRRTLLIVSDAFAKSQWCMWELSLAQHHRLFLDDPSGGLDDSLVIVKLGDVRSSNMTPTLKYLMRTRIYLEWDQDSSKQRLFWEKLRETLTPPTVRIKNTD